MNIHNLWFICILVRIGLIFLTTYLGKINNFTYIISSILLIMGIGFIYKGYFGSNNEIQIAQVFWHETRYIHGLFYILASIYLFNKNFNMKSTLLLSDLLFSVSYRIITNQ